MAGRAPSSGESKHPMLSKNVKKVNCGIFSGLIQAAVFNPWDRALYLSVANHRPFLRMENFKHPMAGLMQTITQRAVSSGLYFPLEDIFAEQLTKLNTMRGDSHGARSINFVAGLLAGATNGFFLNPFSSVKFYYWGRADCGKESFLVTAREMYRKGGIQRFFLGTSATIYRDLIFGGLFALCRHEQHLLMRRTDGGLKKPSKTREFIVNVVSASVATLASSPLNYVRVIHYATPPEVKPDSAMTILKALWASTKAQGGPWEQFVYLGQRLRIGWGTARVGVGMAFSATLYSYCTKLLT